MSLIRPVVANDASDAYAFILSLPTSGAGCVRAATSYVTADRVSSLGSLRMIATSTMGGPIRHQVNPGIEIVRPPVSCTNLVFVDVGESGF
jgi:hypothetical protein